MKRLLLPLLIAGLFPRPAHGDEFFKLSPGPLSKAHEEFDSHDNCTKCHELGKGVTNFLCLDCHQHRPLRDAVRAGKGLHARFKEPCRTCHTEHKGREQLIVDWSGVGGRRNFDHELTGFSLVGVHAELTCTACHKKKLKSGVTSYASVPTTCDGCHKNPHQFTSKDLRAGCEGCHGKGGKTKKLKPSDLPFDHGERTGFALTGKHGKAECKDCHKNANMAMPSKPRACASCHKSPHGNAFVARTCDKCHAPEAAFTRAKFDHDTTGFPLRAKHATNRCAKCHAPADRKPSSDCMSCHKDPHKKRFAGQSCASCHGVGGSKRPEAFDHGARTRFALTAGHATLDCRKCHRGKGPLKFEKFESSDCSDCHAHKSAHGGQFQSSECSRCHKEGGSKDVTKFDHNKDARFALSGFHAELEQQGKCKSCHPSDAFRTGKTACADCHEDAHKGALGADCARCHDTSVRFTDTKEQFDHDRKTAFALEGRHREAKCEGCHPDKLYKTGKSACVDCHRETDPHKGELGPRCEDCHRPEPGAPKFQHEEMTKFVRVGVHLDTKCQRCHVVSFPGGRPPKVGWTQGAALPELDHLFPVPGQACRDCHHDPHEGAYGSACESCHEPSSFQNANAAVHDTGSFRLQGTHDRLRCERCHEPDRPLRGLGPLCQLCHLADDVHNNSLGPNCGRCHSQFDWAPARFNHSSIGFVLRGAHKLARCRDCHSVGTYVGTPRDCYTCHQGDYLRTTRPSHAMMGFGTDCASCHDSMSFRGAKYQHRRFVLRGSHQGLFCERCHPGGQFESAFGGRVVAFDCAACHGSGGPVDKWPGKHERDGYPMTCELCHNEAAWEPARRPR